MLAFVLKRNDWREYDQVISLYTLEAGRIEVLARGVKKILSKNSSFLEPGSLVEAEIIPGKEINHLGSVQLISSFCHTRDRARVFLLSFGLDIFLSFVSHPQKDEQVFKVLYGWINFLEENPSAPIFIIDVFVIKLLGALGFDITEEQKNSLEIKKDLELLLHGDWGVVNNFKFEGNEAEIFHNVVYQFMLYHSVKNINNWAKLAYFSGK